MVRIAVCDDEKVDLEYLAEEIEHGCSCDCEIVKYEDGENLLADSRKQVNVSSMSRWDTLNIAKRIKFRPVSSLV